MERSGPTPSALRRASLPAGAAQEEHLLLLRKATAAGLLLEHMYVPACIGLFSSPFAADFGFGLERASEGAQLDGEFAFYASRRRLRAWPGGGGPHSWTEIFLSTPLTAVSGIGPAAGRRGAQLDEEFCHAPLATDFGPGPDGAAGGAQVGAEFAFLRFSPPTSGLAWMGRWRGALPWRGACLSLFHSLASRREAKLCSVTGPNTI